MKPQRQPSCETDSPAGKQDPLRVPYLIPLFQNTQDFESAPNQAPIPVHAHYAMFVCTFMHTCIYTHMSVCRHVFPPLAHTHTHKRKNKHATLRWAPYMYRRSICVCIGQTPHISRQQLFEARTLRRARPSGDPRPPPGGNLGTNAQTMDPV